MDSHGLPTGSAATSPNTYGTFVLRTVLTQERVLLVGNVVWEPKKQGKRSEWGKGGDDTLELTRDSPSFHMLQEFQ